MKQRESNIKLICELSAQERMDTPDCMRQSLGKSQLCWQRGRCTSVSAMGQVSALSCLGNIMGKPNRWCWWGGGGVQTSKMNTQIPTLQKINLEECFQINGVKETKETTYFRDH